MKYEQTPMFDVDGQPTVVVPVRDATESLSRKERGMRASLEPDWKTGYKLAFMKVVDELARAGIEFTSEDVTAQVGIPIGAGGTVGALMNAAARSGLIYNTGRTTLSEVPRQHAARLAVWRGRR